MKRKTRFKTIDELVCHTTGKTFQAFFLEMRRHEDALRKIYARDKKHVCVPEEVGSFSQVHPKKRLIVKLYRCAVCMKDLPMKRQKK